MHSVFSFVLTAPIQIQEVREAFADAMEGSESLTIVSGKRAPRGDLYERAGSGVLPPTGSPPALGYASGSGIPTGGESPLWSSVWSPPVGVESPSWSKVWSPASGAELPFDPEGEVEPGTVSNNQAASSSKAKTVQWGTTPENQAESSSKAKTVQWATTTTDQEASSSDSNSEGKGVKWGSTTKVYMYGPDPLSPPPGREGYLAKVAASRLPKSGSKSFGANVKTFFSKLGKLKLRPRFQRAAKTGA